MSLLKLLCILQIQYILAGKKSCQILQMLPLHPTVSVTGKCSLKVTSPDRPCICPCPVLALLQAPYVLPQPSCLRSVSTRMGTADALIASISPILHLFCISLVTFTLCILIMDDVTHFIFCPSSHILHRQCFAQVCAFFCFLSLAADCFFSLDVVN